MYFKILLYVRQPQAAVSSTDGVENYKLVATILVAFGDRNWSTSRFFRPSHCEIPFNAVTITPNPPRKKKKNHNQALVQKKKEMLPTIHPRAQVDESYEYPAALVLPPSDIYTIDVIKLIKSQKGLRCKTEHTLLPYISMLT